MSTILNPKQGCYTIHHEIINFSTAQHRFSFGKQRRFPSVKPTTPTDFTVTLNSTFGRRSPSFGIGTRFKNLQLREQRKLQTLFFGFYEETAFICFDVMPYFILIQCKRRHQAHTIWTQASTGRAPQSKETHSPRILVSSVPAQPTIMYMCQVVAPREVVNLSLGLERMRTKTWRQGTTQSSLQ